jgi:hypothetical protein
VLEPDLGRATGEGVHCVSRVALPDDDLPGAETHDLYRLRDGPQERRRQLREGPDGPQRIDFLLESLHRAPSCRPHLSRGLLGSMAGYTIAEAIR